MARTPPTRKSSASGRPRLTRKIVPTIRNKIVDGRTSTVSPTRAPDHNIVDTRERCAESAARSNHQTAAKPRGQAARERQGLALVARQRLVRPVAEGECEPKC